MTIAVETTQTERKRFYVESGFTSADMSITVPYVAASIKAETMEKRANKQVSFRLFSQCPQRLPLCIAPLCSVLVISAYPVLTSLEMEICRWHLMDEQYYSQTGDRPCFIGRGLSMVLPLFHTKGLKNVDLHLLYVSQVASGISTMGFLKRSCHLVPHLKPLLICSALLHCWQNEESTLKGVGPTSLAAIAPPSVNRAYEPLGFHGLSVLKPSDLAS
jgi:hypothetical protein